MTPEPGAEITHARIVQVAALAPGWHYDEYNLAIGFALVEITTEDGQTHTETYYLGTDLGLVHAPDEVYYRAHFQADGTRPFANYDGPDWAPSYY